MFSITSVVTAQIYLVSQGTTVVSCSEPHIGKGLGMYCSTHGLRHEQVATERMEESQKGIKKQSNKHKKNIGHLID